MNYFLKTDDKETGPFTIEELRVQLAELGPVKSSLVRKVDSVEWMTVDSLAESELIPDQPNPMATASLLFGLISLPLLFATLWIGLPLFWITSVAGIIFGYLASAKIDRSATPVGGKRTATCGLWVNYSAALILPITLALIIPVFSKTCEKGNMTQGINNCRQIITAMRIYSADCSGNYPDYDVPNAVNSNEVFRQMFKAGVLGEERIFGCPMSPFNPDGKIGDDLERSLALQKGENHWAMTKGMTDSSPGNEALVFENPDVATWPPRWSAPKKGSTSPGRSWFDGKIIIGTNDSSVAVMKLEDSQSPTLGLAPLPNGTTVFPDLDPMPVILNVAE